MARVKKGDLVAVVAGDDLGKRGRVLRVLPDADQAVVEGVNLQFKHLKKSQKQPQGGRVHKEAPIALCKLMPVDPTTDEPVRVSYRTVDGVKRRFARGSDAAIDPEAKAKGRRPKAEA
jgi:large subunit ribosomal protein L24